MLALLVSPVAMIAAAQVASAADTKLAAPTDVVVVARTEPRPNRALMTPVALKTAPAVAASQR